MRVQAADGVQPLAAPPALIADRPGLRLWHKLDTAFRLPRASAHFLLASPATYDSAAAAAGTHVAVALLEDVLCETTYLAEVAGLSYEARAWHLATYADSRFVCMLRLQMRSHGQAVPVTIYGSSLNLHTGT